MDSTNGALSATDEVAAEVPSSATPAAVEADQTLTMQTEEEKAPRLERNGTSASGVEDGSFSDDDGDGEENTLELAIELFEKGSKAIEDGDFTDAVDSLSRALEIRVANYGELAPECASSYYKYGCALLYKSQEETDPLGDVPKNTPKNSAKDAAVTYMEDGESSKPSSDSKKHDSSPNIDEVGRSGGDNQEDRNEGSEEDDELGEAEEDDSDLDLAWKMLDIARAIFEKNPEDSIEKVNVFAALGEVSMEREDVETSLSDYRRALAILEHLVEPDNRRVVELNFRICLVLELGSKVEEAISYCEKAISLCRSRLERLREDSTKSKDSEETIEKPTDLDKTSQQLSSEPSKLDSEIDVLSSIATELEKKLEDLQQLMSNPKSILTEYLKRSTPTAAAAERILSRDFSISPSINSSQMAVIETGGFDSPTLSTAANDGVRHLGVVGRGIKRAVVSSTGADSSPKKPLSNLSSEKADSCVSEVLSHPQSSESSIK